MSDYFLRRVGSLWRSLIKMKSGSEPASKGGLKSQIPAVVSKGALDPNGSSPVPDYIRIPNVRIGEREYNVISDTVYAAHIGKDFEPNTCDLVRDLARGGKCALDIGANVGMTTLLLSDLYTKVLSFEPTPSTFFLLESNIAENNINNVEIFNVGLGDENISSKITYASGNRSGGFISSSIEASKGHEVEQVKLVRGDTLKMKPDFIKIDVEGYELQVLRGLNETIQEHLPVVMFEVNHWCLNAFQRIALPDFLDEVRQLFPVLLAVEGKQCLDLHNESDRYTFLYRNINENSFREVIGGFDKSRFANFA